MGILFCFQFYIEAPGTEASVREGLEVPKLEVPGTEDCTSNGLGANTVNKKDKNGRPDPRDSKGHAQINRELILKNDLRFLIFVRFLATPGLTEKGQ